MRLKGGNFITQDGLLHLHAVAGQIKPRNVPPMHGTCLCPRRVRWSTCGGLLASASDDRSLRLWSIPPAHAATAGAACAGEAGAPATEPALLQPRHVLWGHTARLWDCCFGGGGVAGGSEGFLATVSEDCSCRLWCLATGQLLGTIKVGPVLCTASGSTLGCQRGVSAVAPAVSQRPAVLAGPPGPRHLALRAAGAAAACQAGTCQRGACGGSSIGSGSRLLFIYRGS